jgi:hypothetical protein
MNVSSRREIDATGDCIQIFKAQLLVLPFAVRSEFILELLDVFIRHLRLCKDFRAEIVNVAGIIGNKQTIWFLISHVATP